MRRSTSRSGTGGIRSPPRERAPPSVLPVTTRHLASPLVYANGFWYLSLGGGATTSFAARVASLSVPAITADIVANGTVLVYLNVPIGPQTTGWTALPFAFANGSPFVALRSAYSLGRLQVAYLYEPTGVAGPVPNVYTATIPDYSFKYIVMAGTVAPMVLNGGVDVQDYEAVVRAAQARGLPVTAAR